MTTNIGTSRTKTRRIFSVPKRLKGKLSINKFLQRLEVGDNVVLMASPSIHKGMYHRRFHGRIGTVVGIRDKCYEVRIKDNGKKKTLVVNPVHLVKVKNGTKNN
ncbi:50S ribosomal protein L21e [Candidatus Woesearchaeota archaeon]|nr:50S ribosomal protein L21e [Candidatus Woesearchaeota archaeon]